MTTTVNTVRTQSFSCGNALKRMVERKVKHLLWLAEAIVGDPAVAHRCVTVAISGADKSAFSVPDLHDPWIVQNVICEAIEQTSADIKRIERSYLRVAKTPLTAHRSDLSHQGHATQSMSAATISRSLNVLERAALVLHAHLGFSIQDCAALIGCHSNLVERACATAVSRINRLPIGSVENAVKFVASEAVARATQCMYSQ